MPKKNGSISALETYKDPSMMDKKIHSLESKILPKKSGLIEISIDDVLDRLSGNKTVNSPAVGGNWHASSSSGSNRCPTYPIHQPSPKNTTPRVMFSPSIHQPPSVRSPSHTLSSTSYPDKNYPDRDTQLTPHIDELDASRTLQTRLHTLASIGRQIEWLTARHREEEETLSLAVRQYLAVNQMKKTEIEGTTVELQAEVHRLGEEKQRMAVMWDTFRTEGEAVIRRMNETIKVLRDQIVEERTSRENAEISFQRQLAEAREMFLLFHEQTVQKINGYENYISSYEATLSEYTSLLEETRKITAILQDENEELKMLCKISENDANQTETIKGLLTELRKEKTERLRIEEQTSILVEAQQRTIDSLEERLRVMQHTPPPNSGKLRGTTPRTNRTERVVDSCFTTPLPADRTPNAPNNTLINILEGSESSADQQIKKNHVHDVILEKAADSKSEESDPSCETLGHSVSDECFRIFVNDFVNSILEKVCREIQLSGMKREHKKFSTAVEELEILQHQYKEELPSSTVKQDVVLEVSRQQHPSDGIEQQHQANSAVDSSTFIQGRINEILNAKKIGYRSGQGSNGTVASTFPSSEENLESSGPRAPMGVASLIQDLHQAQVSEEKIRAETNQQATFFDDETLLESITTELDSVVQDVLFQAHEAYNL